MPSPSESPPPGGRAVEEGALLWQPSAARAGGSRMASFQRWLERDQGVPVAGYHELWEWSVHEVDRFWDAVWRYFDLGRRPGGPVLAGADGAEGGRWFPGAELNYVDRVLRQDRRSTALIAAGEAGVTESLSYGELCDRAGALASALRALGVGPGDRVAGVLTNSAEAVVALLATASLGALWSSCAPEFGVQGMLDRFAQIEPTVLIAVSGYRHGGRPVDLAHKIDALEAALPSVVATVVVGDAPVDGAPVDGRRRRLRWSALLAHPAPLRPVRVPFGHPLWILYSSGTTGPPKPIVHSHGGIAIEQAKSHGLHADLGPGDRLFWFTTTGWMMWNFLVGGLQVGATIVSYDGSPVWPDTGALWRLAAEVGVTFFGAGAPFIEACRKEGRSPRRDPGRLSIHTVGSTGSPLSPEGFAWVTAEVGADVLCASLSGGTDVCTGFLGSCPTLPVRAGELQCRMLGARVAAYDDDGHPVTGAVGELVVEAPMPSMPVRFWGDDDGRRLHASYFERFPGVWCHGDWLKITPQGGCVVYGRSDATLNRGGVRTGTAEFYRVLDAVPDVADSLVVDTSALGREGELLLLVVPGPAAAVGELEPRLRALIRSELSPRHVPDRVLVLGRLPRTITGKRVEIPVRRILLGTPPGDAVSAAALEDPEALTELLGALGDAGLLPGVPVPPEA